MSCNNFSFRLTYWSSLFLKTCNNRHITLFVYRIGIRVWLELKRVLFKNSWVCIFRILPSLPFTACVCFNTGQLFRTTFLWRCSWSPLKCAVMFVCDVSQNTVEIVNTVIQSFYSPVCDTNTASSRDQVGSGFPNLKTRSFRFEVAFKDRGYQHFPSLY